MLDFRSFAMDPLGPSGPRPIFLGAVPSKISKKVPPIIKKLMY
jgi:hypothetical protein